MKFDKEKNYNNWFDSKFYHILYENRDSKEAKKFIRNIIHYLNLDKNALILDAGCGKGRHSIHLEKFGYNVLGIDLAKKSIVEAKKNENSNLKFEVHDMSIPLQKKFDLVLNLFTSFGYKSKEKDIKTLTAFHKNLKNSGVGVLDFLNIEKVKKELIFSETIRKKNILFHIKRSINKKNQLVKEISFFNNNIKFDYVEYVNALNLNDFKKYFEQTNLSIIKIFGDYDLNEFDPIKSSRLIIFFKKKSQSN